MTIKTLFVAVCLFMLAGTALGDLRPIDTQTLLSRETSGGFLRFQTRGVRVFRNGSIESYQGKYSHPLGSLHQDVLDSIKKDLVTVGPLVDPTPQAPRCVDAPTTTYTGYNENYAPVIFFKRSGCHDSSSSGNDALKALLDGLAGADKKPFPKP